MHSHWTEGLKVKDLLRDNGIFSILELGAGNGRNTRQLLGAGYWVVVVNDGMPSEKELEELKALGLKKWIDGVSWVELQKIPADCYDCALVDTDHNYVVLRKELEQLAYVVRQGGLVILHDTVTFARENGRMPDGFYGSARGKIPYPHDEIDKADAKGLGMSDAIIEVLRLGMFEKIAESEINQGAIALRRT